MMFTCISFPILSTESRTEIGLEEDRNVLLEVDVRREKTYLPSRRAGRDVKRDSSWLEVPASNLDRGTGVGVKRHSSNLQ